MGLAARYPLAMAFAVSSVGLRARLGLTHFLRRLGFSDNSILLPLAIVVGIITATTAVGFHLLINTVRDLLYRHWVPASVLYGHGIWLLILLPAAGGLAVGLITTYVLPSREGHGVVDIMESVLRSAGVIRPLSALEKVLTSAISIGSGGSVGAEGPILQIGAAIASGVGMIFQVARAQMPVLIGCGCAAGISAIFDSPIGGVLFTLEIILLDFSVRTFAPVVIASVIANVTTRAILTHFDPGGSVSIFQVSRVSIPDTFGLGWGGVPNFLLLGLVCGFAGVVLTKMLHSMEQWFHSRPIPRAIRPACGGAALGIIGVVYVVLFGWFLLGQQKPIDFHAYPMPAFFGDGYGAVQQLFGQDFYAQFVGHTGRLVLLLVFLIGAKILGSCLTLASGGSGGVIAPSLFIGGATGALLGVLLHFIHLDAHLGPGFYALIGMGATLAAVVHAPLASILILVELTDRHNIIVPAMLASVVATGTARLVFRDSVYTALLRQRGIQVGSSADLSVLRRIIVEQVPLDPLTTVGIDAPFERLLELTAVTGAADYAVIDGDGRYGGMVLANDINMALMNREAIPLLLVRDLVRVDIPSVRSTDDLATVLNTFARYEAARLPVCLARDPSRLVGLISRRSLMNQYQRALSL